VRRIDRKGIFVNDVDRNYFIDQKLSGLVGGVGTKEPGIKSASGQMILGDSDFAQDIKSGLDDLVKKNLRLSA
jgi:polysaccharide deacetylase 2 family uncharacterized protein YibQ